MELTVNLYNEFAYANRVSEVEEIIQNPLLYIFNGNVMEMAFKAYIYHFSNVAIPDVKRNIILKKELNGKSYKDKKSFVGLQYKNCSKESIFKIQIPKKIKERLNEVNKYCEDNDINLIFINVPHNVEFSNRKNDFNLSNAEAHTQKRY